MSRVLIPLPDKDFDTTEVAVPWHLLTKAGHEVVFATEAGGQAPVCDPLLLTGVIFGQLGAEKEPIAFYERMSESPEYTSPLSWSQLQMNDYDALLLPGGHAQGMRQYLGSQELQEKVVEFWRLERPVAAICHGVLVLARSIDPETGNSVLHGRKTTCLPKYMERLAYFLTFWKLGRYYRTYPAYVEEEVRDALTDPNHFARGPVNLGNRGTSSNDKPAFVVEDGNYISARWPGDAYLFTRRLLDKLEK